jgi:phage shock protein PspC (stress-responsive transcriptional regulator)
MHQQPSLIARDETFLGVCAGLGEDFGINPLCCA